MHHVVISRAIGNQNGDLFSLMDISDLDCASCLCRKSLQIEEGASIAQVSEYLFTHF